MSDSQINIRSQGDVSGVAGGNISGVAGKDITGAAGGDISGQVTVAINELPASTDSNKPGIKELLAQLTDAIANSPELDDEDKAEALSQVKTLAEAGKNHSDEGMKKLAKRAVTMLRGIVVALQPTAALVTICKEVLPAIAKFFGF